MIADTLTTPAPPSRPGRIVKPTWQERELTDVGNGLTFAEFNDDFRYCHPRHEWLCWGDQRWEPDAEKLAVQAAKRLAQVWASYAINKIDDPDRQKRLVKHWLKSQSAAGIEAMLKMASTEPGILVRLEALNTDPWLLNVTNGTLNLQTGQLRPATMVDYITKLCPVEYNPNADLSELRRYLDRVVPDPAVQTFLQRAVGYSLSGNTREEKLFFVCGPTASGKSTFAEAVKAALGDYALTADFESFIRRQATGGPRNDIARLDGARIVMSIEVADGQRLAEGLIKMITGGDTVTARLLYQESREFRPRFKLWLFSNTRPRASDDDSALWRRVLLVPFEQTIPEGERDPSVKARLQDPTIGGPAVLSWAVRGCLDWQRDGLQVPDAVRAATTAYRMENDPLADWLEDRCDLKPSAATLFSDLYKDYKQYAEAAGARPITGKALALRLEKMGLKDFRASGEKRPKAYLGIALKSALDL